MKVFKESDAALTQPSGIQAYSLEYGPTFLGEEKEQSTLSVNIIMRKISKKQQINKQNPLKTTTPKTPQRTEKKLKTSLKKSVLQQIFLNVLMQAAITRMILGNE